MRSVSREQFAQLVAAQKSRLRRELRYVPETITDWDDRDFLVVTNKQGNEGVLIVPFMNDAVLSFTLDRRMPNDRGRAEAIICDICATWQRGTHSAVITFTPSSTRTVSFLCCEDLECSLHVRGMTSASTLSRAQLRENTTPEERITRLCQRLGDIVSYVQG